MSVFLFIYINHNAISWHTNPIFYLPYFHFSTIKKKYIFTQYTFYIEVAFTPSIHIPHWLIYGTPPHHCYCKTSNISHTLVGNKLDHSDAVGASPVRAAPTKSSSWLDTWVQWIWQRQLQNKMRKNEVARYGAFYNGGFMVVSIYSTKVPLCHPILSLQCPPDQFQSCNEFKCPAIN